MIDTKEQSAAMTHRQTAAYCRYPIHASLQTPPCVTTAGEELNIWQTAKKLMRERKWRFSKDNNDEYQPQPIRHLVNR
jgi:hypothetical protein